MAFLVICSCNGLLAVLRGKDLNWDLLNYHFYNPYAFLTGRLDLDVAPAQVQTFLNPLIDIPLYLAIVTLPPVVVGTVYGFVQGLNGGAVWLIAREVLPIEDTAGRDWAALGLALLGGLGTINVTELGGGMGDTLASIPVLLSLALLVRRRGQLETAPLLATLGWAGSAGAISGIGIALKLTSALYSAGFAVGCLFLVRTLGRRLLVAAAFGAGAVASWLGLSSFWLWEMWTRFGNPFFPFFNRVFGLDFGALYDDRFLPKSLISAVLYPLAWAIYPRTVAELTFRDWRFPIVYSLLAVLAVRWVVQRWGAAPLTARLPVGPTAFLLAGALASYALWLRMFGVYRYLAPLECLVPLGMTLVLWTLLPARHRTLVIVVALVLTTVTTRPMSWGRAGWSGSYFGVVPPRLERPDSSMVLIAGFNALSFLIPYFPPKVPFVRIQSNSYLYGMVLGGPYYSAEGQSPNRLDRRVREAIAAHHGSLYVMFADATEVVDTALQKLGLRRGVESCERVHTIDASPIPVMPRVVFCPVTRGPSVAKAFFDSPEFQEAVAPIARLYFAYFNRIPDLGGLRHWIAQHKAGMSLAAISGVFATSPEFRTTYGSLTNKQFVALVYHNVLGREPDSAGFVYWTGQLDTGAMTRGQVMLGLSESPEYQQASYNPVFVTMIYYGMLGRVPDAAGFQHWVAQLNAGASRHDLVKSFLGTVEYKTRFRP